MLLTLKVEASASEAWDLWTSPKKTTDESGFILRGQHIRALFTSTWSLVTSTVTKLDNFLYYFSSFLDIASLNQGVMCNESFFCET